MEKEVCPKCKVELKVVYFLGVEPDFFVCPKCRLAYSLNIKENKKPLAHVIML